MSAADSEPTFASPASRSVRSWFPLVWNLSFAGIGVASQYLFEDPGISNVLAHLSVMCAVGGTALWILLRGGWPLTTRLLAASVLALPLVAHYTQVSPIEFVNNGDVGLVDWRWRWEDPDRDLEAASTKATTELLCVSTSWDYPRFLGEGYWAEVKDAILEPDWEANPPKELWKQRIGAGWSGFSVVGQLAYTQEQRGEQEMVTCYDLQTGELLWSHGDEERFDPSGGGSLGGVGPQATPTVFDSRVYSHGATGIFNCLDAATGEKLWSYDTAEEFGVPTLLWGKSASPLIVGNLVVLSIGDAAAHSGEELSGKGNSLVAFDRITGEVVWQNGDRTSSYASPVLATLLGTQQILVVNEDFITAQRASDGKVLWEHPWPGKSDSNASTSQPIPLGDDQVFISKGYGIGSELIQLTQQEDAWSAETVWKKNVMKTKMCNVVVRDGYAYGLDDVNLSCIELATGKKQWKKRRRPSFGRGQILLAGEHIIVATEEGEVVLVAVDHEEYRELASFQAIEGVTWNNPTLVDSRLLVRNAVWAACFELPVCQTQAAELVSLEDPNAADQTE